MTIERGGGGMEKEIVAGSSPPGIEIPGYRRASLRD
jgi:hypothetical protein